MLRISRLFSVVIILLLASLIVEGQQKTDLKDYEQLVESDQREAVLLLELAEKKAVENKSAEAIEITTKYYRLALEHNWPDKQINALLLLADLNNDISDYKGAHEHLQRALIQSETAPKESNRLGDIHYRLAKTYELMADYKQSFSHYTQALNIYREKKDWSGLSKSYQGIGVIYRVQSQHEKALDYFREAYQFAKLSKDSTLIASIFNSQAVVHLETGDPNKALQYYNRILDIHKLRDDPLNTAVTLNNLGVLYGQMGKMDSAKNAFQNALNISQNIRDTRGVASALSNLSLAEYIGGNLPQAEKYQKKAIQQALPLSNFELIARLYQRLVQINHADNDYKTAFENQSIYIAYRDSAHLEKSENQLAALQARFETAEKEKEIELLQKENTIARLWRNILIFGLAFVLIIALLLFYLLRLRIRKNRQLYEKEQAIMKMELEKTHLKEQQLESEIEMKSKQLTTHTLNLIQKNKLLEELSQKVKELRKPNGQLQNKLSEISRFINYSLNIDKDWEEFQLYFERVNRDFFKNLKEEHPDLSTAELRLAALVKLNMTIKEASSVLNISPGSVKTARYRLRKRFDLNIDDDLRDYLMKF